MANVPYRCPKTRVSEFICSYAKNVLLTFQNCVWHRWCCNQVAHDRFQAIHRPFAPRGFVLSLPHKGQGSDSLCCLLRTDRREGPAPARRIDNDAFFISATGAKNPATMSGHSEADKPGTYLSDGTSPELARRLPSARPSS